MSGYGVIQQLYQIGDVHILNYLRGATDINHSALGDSVQLQDTYRVALSHSPQTVSLPKYQVDLQLYSTQYWSDSEILERLKGMEGQVVDLIAFERSETPCPDLDVCPDCACNDSCPCHLLWLHTFGRITSVRTSSPDQVAHRVRLEIEYLQYWKIINRLLFALGEEGVDPSPWYTFEWDTINIRQNLGGILSCDGIGKCLVWYRRCRPSLSELYDPTYFNLIHDYGSDPVYPVTGVTTDFNANPLTLSVNSRDAQWSAPPLSYYVFNGVNTATGQAEITIESEDSLGCLHQCQTTIDFDSINQTALNEAVTLLPDDRLIIGDVKNEAFILRGETPLLFVTNSVLRNCGRWPGQLKVGRNLVDISLPSGVEVAQHHWFRRLH